MRVYINKQTGEIISRVCRLSAYRYFKADGKHYNYKCKLSDVVEYRTDGNKLKA